MPETLNSSPAKPRVRFAPSPTGFLHVGSARTFIFNWLYARRNGGTMILRLDDTDVERNTDASVNSIFEGLKWLGLDWDEEYKQSERGELHRQMADAIFQKGLAYRDFTPAHTGDSERSGAQGTWLFNPGMRELSREESDRRAAAGEPFALRFRVPRDGGQTVRFTDAVYGEQVKAAADIEDFALLRSDGMPTYHLASCADDADLRISHIIRGQDHLSNTFKHVLIFEAAGFTPPQFAHLPLLVAPDGTKLSKRRHGPVVSVTTYRDAGFLPEAFINFLCLLGWSPKNDREQMTRQELIDAFSLEGINRANAVVNFKENASSSAVIPSEASTAPANVVIPSEARDLGVTYHEDTFDPKALWLNAEHIRGLPIEDLSQRLLPIVRKRRLQRHARKDAAHHAAHPRAHQAAARRAHRRRLLLRRPTAALRSRRTHPAKGRRRHGEEGFRESASRTRQCRVQARSAGSGPARRRPGTRHQGRTDVPAHPRRSLRPQKRPAAVRNVRSLGPRNNINANQPGDESHVATAASAVMVLP